ncbi:MAG TPA: type II toxin-antitoxin system VapC family toxin [Candidatus Sulfopaludibacter sp.]|nr:type II toxin-antitoxin system VapC family toxin [Candidatus Sulfopaludibacter sp.]
MTVLVDSDILIEVSRGRNTEVVSKWIDLSSTPATVLYSPVTSAELWAGARPSEYKALDNLFRALTCVPLDDEVGRLAGMYLRQYRRSHGVELGDALIAASAVAIQAELWTRNRKHYPMKDISFFDGARKPSR